ncbi:MAG: hypothetical protein QOG64_2095, partial [Acidimicrobiaceae bacterium]|nr:hypothetical protein [Acidimicrobiaceae bacterium]
MRIAVYNHFWATAGGGEAEALVLAEALTKFGRVELWTPPGVNFDALGQQFGVDVGDLEPRL